jgi:sugar phosphate isomerase/epimerase
MVHCFADEIQSHKMSVYDFIEFCRNQPIQGVELWDALVPEGEVNKIKRAINRSNLEVSCYDINCDFVLPRKPSRDLWVERTLRAMDRAKTIGSNVILVSPGAPKDGVSLKQAEEWIIEGLTTCCDYARDEGLTLTTENHGIHVALRGTTGQMQKFLGRIPRLDFTYDGGNFLLAEEDPLSALEVLHSRIVHVHLKDFARVDALGEISSITGKNYVHAVVGGGVLDLRAIIQGLRLYGYERYLSIETRSGMVSDSVKNVKLILDSIIKHNNIQ